MIKKIKTAYIAAAWIVCFDSNRLRTVNRLFIYFSNQESVFWSFHLYCLIKIEILLLLSESNKKTNAYFSRKIIPILCVKLNYFKRLLLLFFYYNLLKNIPSCLQSIVIFYFLLHFHFKSSSKIWNVTFWNV